MSSPISRKWEHAVVTGGAGFVGSHLCTALLDAGAAVTCVDDLSTGRPENIAPLLDRPGFTLVQADVSEELPVSRRPDLVLHFASPASPADYLRLPLHTMETGSLGTRNALALEGGWLVLDRVAEGRPGREAAVRFGRDLAGLHTTGAPAFGTPPPGGPVEAFIGPAPMRNVTGDFWPGWYAEHRVLPYLRRAVDEGTVTPGEAASVERVCERLPELAGPAEPPARLHGDLWNGNVLWGADGRVRVIDPAAHGGHRETDLAMLELFGCPLLDAVLDGYEDVAPLAEGRRARVGVHQLFPLLVHAVLFGRGYAEQALDAARSALSR
ncbi:fructosamine kinase family protein [Streptomyces tendae]|uniref:NAD-dependent epimerase/dehydratase family protein n=1 Tax=Streptomyces tendae TaxID=1932 RepID=A0ABX5ZTX3_STRTE|nr:fructosamine kinase family protein [Streptomyces tendae]QER88031.1 NAD-dependent epimerase/dehydratase family protein [Streptomyces tendae]